VAQQVVPGTDPYQEALDLLEKGSVNSAIEHYNRLIESVPNHAGAWLDLALLYCERGDTARALEIFDRIEQKFAPPPAIQEIIAHYRANGCVSASAAVAHWTVSAGIGRTDNVNHGLTNTLIDLTFPSGTSSVRLADTYSPRGSVEGILNASYVRNIRALPGVQWFAGLTEKNFPSAGDFKQQALLVGITQQHMFGNWEQSSQFAATNFSLDDQTHQTGMVGQVALWLPPYSAAWPRLGFELEASRWRYAHEPDYNNTIIETRVAARWNYGDRFAIRGSTGYLVDRASGLRPGLDRHGYVINAGGQWVASERILLDATFRQRVLQDAAIYSPLFGDNKHHSRQLQLILDAQYRDNAKSPYTWKLELERSQSRDNVPLFPYTSHTLTLYWQYQRDVF